MRAWRRASVGAATVVVGLASVLVLAPPGSADEPNVITGHVSTSTDVPLDIVLVEACPAGTPHAFFPNPCAGGVVTSASVNDGWYELTLPGTGSDWNVQAVGPFCSTNYFSPATALTVSGTTTHGPVIDTSSLVEPTPVDLAPPFADGADPAGETDPSDGRLHLALRDTSRRILVGRLLGRPAGEPCANLHVLYRPLQVVVLIPAGTGPFPLLVASHGLGEEAPNLGRVAGALQYVDRGYVVAVPTYPLTASYGSWPGGYAPDVDDQGPDLAFILEELMDLPFVDADRMGLAGISGGGITSLMAAFHETGFDGGLRAVAPTIARPLTAPNEITVPLRAGDVPLFMSNNVHDNLVAYAPAAAFWQAATAPKYRWVEDTPNNANPQFDHGFTSPEPSGLIALFFDAYLKGDPAARAQLDATADPAGPEFTYEAVPGVEGFRGPLEAPLVAKRGRAVPLELQLWAEVGALQASITGPGGFASTVPLTFDRVAGTYEAQWRTTKGMALGPYTVSVVSSFGTFTQTVTLR
jgi:dienelactone hydrolase